MRLDPDRFWDYVDLLGGVADASSTPHLQAALEAAGDEAAFEDDVAERVETLLAACTVPPDHLGDTAEWIAAAVIAAGRAAYETALSAGGELDPEAWAWDDAEYLLVVGVPVDPPRADVAERERLHLHVEWRTPTLPADVTSSYDAFIAKLVGEDESPAFGMWVSTDPAWDAVLDELLGTPSWLERREATIAIQLRVVVKEVEEVATTTWNGPEGSVTSAVVVVPSAWFTDDPDDRQALYLRAIDDLLTLAEALG